MKAETIVELQSACAELDFMIKGSWENPDEVRDVAKRAREAIIAAMYRDTPRTYSRFNLQAVALPDSDKNIRPAMTGVYHEGGYRVASDGSVLFALKGEYPEEQEGKIIGRDGREIVATYPKFRDVYPTTEPEAIWEIDPAKILDFERRLKAENKAAKKSAIEVEKEGFVYVGETCFKLDKIAILAKFMESYKCNKLKTWGKRRAACVDAEDGSWGLIMPVRRDDDPADERAQFSAVLRF